MDVVRPCRPTDVTVRAQASCETRKFAVRDGDFLHPIDINNVVYMPVLIEHVRCYFEAGCEKWMHEMSINFFAMACCRKSKLRGPTWNVFRCSTGQALVHCNGCFVLKTDERFVSEVCMLVRLAGIINPTDHVCWDKREWACFAPSFQGVLACPPKIATVRKMIFTST